MKRCSRCGLSASDWGVHLDSKMVCNYCNYYEQAGPKLRDFARYEKLLQDRFDRFCGKYEYDVVVGLSGGKDSTFLVYTLKNHYGLKVLTFTSDFGFMPTDPARKNIDKVVSKLGVDHLYYAYPPPEIYQKSFRNAGEKLGWWPCVLCDTFILCANLRLALDHNIPFAITANSRGQIFRNLAPGYIPANYLYSIKNQLSPYSSDQVKISHQYRLKYLDGVLGKIGGLSREERRQILSPGRKKTPDVLPEYLFFFLYRPYDERKIKNELEEKLGWQRPTGDAFHFHYDCALHDAAEYANRGVLGGALLNKEICVDVREKMITREEAIQRITGNDEFLNTLDNPLERVPDYFNFTPGTFQRRIAMAGRLSRLAKPFIYFRNHVESVLRGSKSKEDLL